MPIALPGRLNSEKPLTQEVGGALQYKGAGAPPAATYRVGGDCHRNFIEEALRLVAADLRDVA